MRISTLFYTLQQGIKSIFRNKIFSLATVATISACIFLFGIFYSVMVNFQNIIHQAESGVAVTVFFDPDITDAQIQQIGQDISMRAEVSKVVFVSAEQAWADFKDEYLGEYADTFGDDNPLEDDANYEVYLSDVSMQEQLVEYIAGLAGVKEIHKSANVANTLSMANSLVSYVSLAIIFILFAVSIFLISNTVAIGISVRREEIAIMKLIGASDFVVRSPFLFEGIILGLIGAAIPLVIIYYIYNEAIQYVIQEFAVLNSILAFLPVEQIFYTLVPIALILGVGIGFLGSALTVRRHLRV